MKVSSVIALLSCSLCAGCTILTSETASLLDQQERAPEGVHYSLPKGVVDMALYVDPTNVTFRMAMDGLRFVPDERLNYFMRYRPLPNYEDMISIETNKFGFLTKVSATSVDRTPDIVVNVAKALSAFGAFESAPIAEGEILLRSLTFDPTDAGELGRARAGFKSAMQGHIEQMRKACKNKSIAHDVPAIEARVVAALGSLDAKITTLKVRSRILEELTKAELATASKNGTPPPSTFSCGAVKVDYSNAPEEKLCMYLNESYTISKELTEATNEFDATKAQKDENAAQKKAYNYRCNQYDAAKAQAPVIELETFEPSVAQPGTHGTKQDAGLIGAKPDCSIGLCYRPKEPLKLVYGLDGRIDTQMIELPNRSDVVTIDIRRAFFIKKVQEIAFDGDGFLTAMSIHKESELVAISKLPVDVIKAVADGLRIRVDLIQRQRDVVQHQAELLKARAALRDTRAQLESASMARGGAGLEAAAVRPFAQYPRGIKGRSVPPKGE